MQEESLEQALKLQIQKRIEVESKATKLHSHIYDLQELLEALVLEVSTNEQAEQGEEEEEGKCKGNTGHDALHPVKKNDMNDIDGLDHDDDDDDDIDNIPPSSPPPTPTMTSSKNTTTPMTTDNDSKMDRKDVLWMLKEIQIRTQTMVEHCCNGNQNDGSSDNDDKDDEKHLPMKLKLRYEMELAKLQGQLTQIQELYNQTTSTRKDPPQARESTNTTTTTTTVQEQTMHSLQTKYQRLEKRHGIMLKDMQEELQEKQKRIQILEKELESAVGLKPHGMNSPLGQHHQTSTTSSPVATFQCPHKDLFIASLQEDIEERDLVIAELKSELEVQQGRCERDGDGVGVGVGVDMAGDKMSKVNGDTMIGHAFHRGSYNHHGQEADKVRIKYMEDIIHGLEKKIEYLEQCCSTNGAGGRGMEDSRMMPHPQYQSPLMKSPMSTTTTTSAATATTTTTRKRENLHDWLDDSPRLFDESLAPDGYSSLQVEDMELLIAELMARLKDCQEEKMSLEDELSQWKGNTMENNKNTPGRESHAAGPQ